MKHSSHDLLVYSNGTIRHNVIINAEVNCEVNLFNYPFAFDACPVAIQAWTVGGEGRRVRHGDATQVTGFSLFHRKTQLFTVKCVFRVWHPAGAGAAEDGRQHPRRLAD